jgi:hypothetical protein
VRVARLVCALVLLAGVSIEAHKVPPQVDAYFKVGSGTLRVLARLPLATLSDARLPTNVGGTLNLAASGPTFDAAVADLARNLAIMDGDQPLTTPSASWVVAVPNDVSFATYAWADKQLSGPPLSPDTLVDANNGFVDVALDYALKSTTPRLSARFNGLRVGGSFIPTHAIYLTADGGVRIFMVTGAPHRVPFEPSWADTTATFARLGIGRIAGERVVLLFLFCLAIPRRRMGVVFRVVAIFVGSYLAAGLVTAIVPAGPAVILTSGCALVASAALLLAAIQNIADARLVWVQAVSVVCGLASGVGAGAAARELMAFAGSHAATGLLIFLGVPVLAFLGLSRLLLMVTAWFSRLPLSERVVTVLLTLLPLHTALHQLGDDGEALGVAGAGSGGVWTAVLANWPPLVAVLALVALVVLSRLSAGAARSEAG